MLFISYAQNGEDVVLWRALKDVERGFYIDVGACDPDELSVTKAFYERGWHGLNIEPVRQYHELCVAKRPRDINLNVAVAAKSGIAHFMVVSGTGLSTTVDAVAAKAADKGWPVEAQDVPALSLSDICETLPPGEIHFLKIDVEGGERAVLEGADFGRYRPWVVVVEATVPLSTERNEHLWEDLLLQARYERAFFDGVNLYYVAQEHADLIGRLAAPPNALDDFKPVRLADAEERIAELTAEVAAGRRGLEETRAASEDMCRQHETLKAQATQQAEAQDARIAELTAEVAAGRRGLEETRAASEELRQQAEAQSAVIECLEATLAQTRQAMQNEVAELRSQLSHQASSAHRAVDFATRNLAQSRRKAMELEQQVDVQRSALEAIAGLFDLAPQEGGAEQFSAWLGAKLEQQTEELERRAETVALLQSRYRALDSEHAVLKQHRDKLLSSTSWRLSAPLRKIKTASQVARREPRQFVPLVMHNLHGRQPQRETPLLAAPSTTGGGGEPVASSVSSEATAPPPPAPTRLPLPEQGAMPGTPEYEALDQRGQVAALIRRDIAQRRLAGQQALV